MVSAIFLSALLELVGEAHAHRQLALELVARLDAGHAPGRLAPAPVGPPVVGLSASLSGTASAGAMARCLMAGSIFSRNAGVA